MNPISPFCGLLPKTFCGFDSLSSAFSLRYYYLVRLAWTLSLTISECFSIASCCHRSIGSFDHAQLVPVGSSWFVLICWDLSMLVDWLIMSCHYWCLCPSLRAWSDQRWSLFALIAMPSDQLMLDQEIISFRS